MTEGCHSATPQMRRESAMKAEIAVAKYKQDKAREDNLREFTMRK